MKPKSTEKEKDIRESLQGIKAGDPITIIARPVNGLKINQIIQGNYSRHEKMTQHSAERSVFLTRNDGAKVVEMVVNEFNIERILVQ